MCVKRLMLLPVVIILADVIAMLPCILQHQICKYDQLNEHMAWNKLMEPKQSAYRYGHITETALLKVCDDMLRALDNQEAMCLVLLDLSATFNAVDHGILSCLESNYGITDTALAWIRSYLSNCSQKVVVCKAKSNPITLTFGVPQESVLGPILFTLYTSPLGQTCTKHRITYHLYADDQQIYLAFKLSKKDCARRFENCIGEIRMWMSTNMLKLNDDKTEFSIFGTRQQLAKFQEITIVISDTRVQPVE